MSLYQNKYRNESARLHGYDYSLEGAYFITICTKNRNHYFGKIFNGEMILNDIGIITEEIWFEIRIHYPSAILGAFVIMPNHIHGIIIIDYSVKNRLRLPMRRDMSGPYRIRQSGIKIPFQIWSVHSNRP
jgi:putative transposase